MTGMPSSAATARMAGSETQPSCFCTSHRMAITADCCRPAGKLAIQRLASFKVAGANSKLAGWSGERRRTLKLSSLHEVDADDQAVGDSVDGGHLEGLAAGLARDLLVV